MTSAITSVSILNKTGTQLRLSQVVVQPTIQADVDYHVLSATNETLVAGHLILTGAGLANYEADNSILMGVIAAYAGVTLA